MYLDNINIKDIIYNLINKVKLIAIRVPYNYDFKKLLEITDKSYIFTFKKPNGRLNYFLIILLSKKFF